MSDIRIGSRREGLIFENGSFHPEQRTVVREQIWNVTVNGQAAGSFACTPAELEDAGIGYLYLSGMISCLGDVASLEIFEDAREIRARIQPSEHSPKAVGAPTELPAAEVFERISWLENRRGKGVHSCALIQGDNLVFRQDVSRSTAVDKAAGACLRQGIPTENAVLVFSGRVPEGIVRKCIAMGCRTILACSGPTDLACEEAEKAGITIAGSAGPGRFCVYTCPERIV